MSKSNILMIVFFAFAFLYMAFHVGKYYEYLHYRDMINSLGENATDAEVIIPDGLENAGEVTWGNCVYTTDGLNAWYDLFMESGNGNASTLN